MYMLGAISMPSFPALSGSDVMRMVRQMPRLEELVVKGVVWVGDYIGSVPHQRLKRLRIERVQCMGPRSDPLVMVSYVEVWTDLQLKDIHWCEGRNSTLPAFTTAHSLSISLPLSIMEVAQFVDRLPRVDGVHILSVGNLTAYGSQAVNRIAKFCRRELEELTLDFVQEEEGRWCAYHVLFVVNFD